MLEFDSYLLLDLREQMLEFDIYLQLDSIRVAGLLELKILI